MEQNLIMNSNDHQKIQAACHKMCSFIDNVIRASTIIIAPTRQTAIPCRMHRGRNRCDGFLKGGTLPK